MMLYAAFGCAVCQTPDLCAGLTRNDARRSPYVTDRVHTSQEKL